MVWVTDDLGSAYLVAELVGRWKIDMFSAILLKMAEGWGNPVIIVENNAVGQGVTRILEERKCVNLYRGPQTDDVGFRTTETSKVQILVDLEYGVRQREIFIARSTMVTQMQTFVHKYNPRTKRITLRHEDGYHDDTIMASAIAIHAIRNRKVARVSAARPAGL